MKTKFWPNYHLARWSLALLCAVPAAQATAPDAPGQPPGGIALRAPDSRDTLAHSVGDHSLSITAALAQMRASRSSTRLNFPPAVDFAYAAIDLGHRLLAAGKPTEAVTAFQAAEAALEVLVRTTPDARAHDKAQYLQSLAFIRGRYLSKAAQSKADIEQALALKPDEKSLTAVRRLLASDRADVYSPPRRR